MPRPRKRWNASSQNYEAGTQATASAKTAAVRIADGTDRASKLSSLGAILDARTYMLALSENREHRAQWQ